VRVGGCESMRARRASPADAGARLSLTQWLVLMTNVPEALLSAQEVGVLARVRWQVEILFRVWKSCFRVDECCSRNVWRVLCELYAKLMVVVLWHWLLLVWRGGVWDRSLHKAARAFQRLSVVLEVCWRCGWGLGVLLELFEACMATCRVGKRRGCPATFQRILELEGLT
jgi:hypothetical protein